MSDKLVNVLTTLIGLAMPVFGMYAMVKLDKVTGWDLVCITFCALILIYIKNGKTITGLVDKVIDKKVK